MAFSSPSLLLNILIFVVGVATLVKGSDWFIDGAVGVAHRFRISEAIVGLTLVSLGTSLPELATNVYSAVIDKGAVAMGNVTGSNVAIVPMVGAAPLSATERAGVRSVGS